MSSIVFVSNKFTYMFLLISVLTKVFIVLLGKFLLFSNRFYDKCLLLFDKLFSIFNLLLFMFTYIVLDDIYFDKNSLN